MKSQPIGPLPHACTELLRALAHYWKPELDDLRLDSVVAVPNHWLRTQHHASLSKEWARVIAEALGLELLPLLQHQWIQDLRLKPQKEQSRSERLLKRPRWTVPHFSKSRVLLVDDVRASGQSLAQGQKLLEASGHQVVGTFVLAQAL